MRPNKQVGLGILSALVTALALCACRAGPSATCPPPSETAQPTIVNGRAPAPMPLGQFLGRTRQQNETLLTPQSVQPLTGWVIYAPGFSIRYRGQQAVALKATFDATLHVTGTEAAAWAGFQSTAAPVCQGHICHWEVGQLCYQSQPLAATWDSASGELYVWQAD